MRRRGLMLERPFAHCLETGGLRRIHLRGRSNILKRMLVHYAAFNLSLIQRQQIGKGTPRGLQGLLAIRFPESSFSDCVIAVGKCHFHHWLLGP